MSPNHEEVRVRLMKPKNVDDGFLGGYHSLTPVPGIYNICASDLLVPVVAMSSRTLTRR
jgi:hypothetical protein